MADDTGTPDPAAHVEHARSHINFLLANSPIYTHLLSSITVESASPGYVRTLLPLEAHHVNSKATLHGSVTATLVDFIGGVAIACYDLRSNTGVSTDMHISFCGKAVAGQAVQIEGFCEKVGGTLAFTRAVIKNAHDGSMVASGSHTKFVKQR